MDHGGNFLGNRKILRFVNKKHVNQEKLQRLHRFNLIDNDKRNNKIYKFKSLISSRKNNLMI